MSCQSQRRDDVKDPKNIECPSDAPQPQFVAPRYVYVEGVDPDRDARLRADGFTPVHECQRTYPLDPDTAEDPCEDCGRDQRKHEIARDT
jgi:hypothetical protein